MLKRKICAASISAAILCAAALPMNAFAEAESIDISSLTVVGTDDYYNEPVEWTEDSSFMTKLDEKATIDETEYDVYTFENAGYDDSFYGVKWTCEKDGWLQMYVKTSTERFCDGLAITQNSADLEYMRPLVSGENDWQPCAFPVAAGEEYLIGYSKDINVDRGDDRIWIAGITFEDGLNVTDEISTAQELVDFADRWNSGEIDYFPNVTVTADIDMTGIEWEPINEFFGVFDGGNHTISNLTLSNESNNGLFEEVNSSIVKNLTLKDVTITASQEFESYIGALAVYADHTIVNNCHVDGMTGTDLYAAAGLVCILGESNTVTDCSVSNIELSAYDYAGGLSAAIENGNNIIRCTVSNASIESEDDSAGGMVGIIGYKNNTFTNCYASAEVKALISAGGMIGIIDYENNTFTNCYAEGSVTAEQIGGGFAGINSTDCTITNCYTTSDVISQDIAGGFVGGLTIFATDTSTFTNCVSTGNVTSTNPIVAGLVIGALDENNKAISSAFNGFYLSDSAVLTVGEETFSNLIGTDFNLDASKITVCDVTSDEAVNALNEYARANEGLKTWGVIDGKISFAEYFTVSFIGFDGEELNSFENVMEGTDLTDSVPNAPEVDGYEFTGWDTDITNIQENLTVTAIYEKLPDESSSESEPESSEESSETENSSEESSESTPENEANTSSKSENSSSAAEKPADKNPSTGGGMVAGIAVLTSASAAVAASRKRK